MPLEFRAVMMSECSINSLAFSTSVPRNSNNSTAIALTAVTYTLSCFARPTKHALQTERILLSHVPTSEGFHCRLWSLSSEAIFFSTISCTTVRFVTLFFWIDEQYHIDCRWDVCDWIWISEGNNTEIIQRYFDNNWTQIVILTANLEPQILRSH